MNSIYKTYYILSTITLLSLNALAAGEDFTGLDTNLGNLYRTSSAQTRSISAENPTGGKGQGAMAPAVQKYSPDDSTSGWKSAARDLGQGWKTCPASSIKAGETITLANIEGPGCIQQMWMVPLNGNWRFYILRFYWDDEADPSVEVPIGDFFANGWGKPERSALVNSLPICVNPRDAFNCYWQMPFRKRCKITMENLSNENVGLAYQINYALAEVPGDAAYFHAQFRRENPVKTKGLYPILDGVKGKGQYVGTYLAWSPHRTGWWGEGEVKFYIDGDKEFPTICGTGTEDYFCGSFDFDMTDPDGKVRFTEFNTPYSGLAQVIRPDGHYDSQTRFGMYRWHITDPVRFQNDLKVTIQDLGWQYGGFYVQQQDDIASVAYWYQTEPHQKFPPLPSRGELECFP